MTGNFSKTPNSDAVEGPLPTEPPSATLFDPIAQRGTVHRRLGGELLQADGVTWTVALVGLLGQLSRDGGDVSSQHGHILPAHDL